jgi:hypothetical protein
MVTGRLWRKSLNTKDTKRHKGKQEFKIRHVHRGDTNRR